MSAPFALPPMTRSLSARLLVLTVVFVMLSEVLIYVPSIAAYRKTYLEARITAAHLATLALDASPDRQLDPALEQMLLDHAQVLAVELWRPMAELMLGKMPEAQASFDLRKATPWSLIHEAFMTLEYRGRRIVRLVGPSPHDPGVLVEVFMNEGDLFQGMYDYSWRILHLSILISLITAVLVYLSLQWLMVRPMRRITRNLMEFRDAPEDPSRVIVPSRRRDEIGMMQAELARMQTQLRAALQQKSRLAALGTAVSAINHDLRNILSTAMLVSERLARIPDPAVQRVSPMLVSAVDKAVHLCTQTLDLARGDQAVPRRTRFPLRELVSEVGESLGLTEDSGVHWHNAVDATLAVDADHDRLFRVLLNLGRNAVQALGSNGDITVRGRREPGAVSVEVRDSGPGIPKTTLARLFEPFAGSGNAGGTGLGLATARDLMRAHGGDLELVETGSQGTTFRLTLPDSDAAL